MSGGVDSAVAAVLCGQRAVAVTLELWSDPGTDGERSCCSPQAVRGARALAHGLGLPHLSLDLRAEFREGVVDQWLAGHRAGETPNPCVRCNGRVRIDAMVELAARLGADALATGHYARVQDGLVRVAADAGKDQSYMLAAVAPATLERLRFPLGELHKEQVRELAGRAGLAVARKPDSQDLCFLAGAGRDAFLARHGALGERPGRSSTPRAASSPATPARTVSRSGSAAACGSAAARRSTCSRPTPPPTRSRSARAEQLAARTVALREPVLHGDRVLTACGCATASAPSAAPASAATGASCSRSPSRSTASLPGSSPA